MKTITPVKKLFDWSGYIFKEMINNLDIIPEYFMINDFKGCKDGSIIYVMQKKICSTHCF